MAPLRSLRSRIFVATAVVAALALSLALGLVTSRAGREAEVELRRDLERASSVLAEQQAGRLETLRTVAGLVADLPKLKAAVDTGDPATIQPIALDYLGRAGAALLFVSDRRGALLASVGRPVAREALDVASALEGRERVRFQSAEDGVVEVLTVPIAVESEILGSLGLGFVVDDAEASRFKAATDSEVAIVGDGRVCASTLPREHGEVLLRAAASRGVQTVRFGGTDWVTLARPLSDAEGAPTALLLRSRSERLAFLRTLRGALLAAASLAALLAVVLSWGVARSVARPLSALTAAMREMALTGDLTPRLPVPGRLDDEDALLVSRSFGSLAGALERFQREAALRDRLSALGRLSTVIAHEVRNPLMSIKASLAALLRAASPEAIREAAADIDHEVARLDRIVGDVLDFARPVRVEYARADVNALVREAAEAVLPRERLDFDLAPGVLELDTDADRLRAALVNVLQNAREAVDAGSAAAPAVVVRTRARDARVLIEVADRGPGIPAEHLSQVFEPYFTTKRSGTGLGLPIARNVVDALRGTIRAASREGGGTEIAIELPREAPR
ncbi:MAG TPA: ATP-binding protein [Vicinamibacteria bacterium]|nr:ATP-binding protein [Vicinamibacteria bacterium]